MSIQEQFAGTKVIIVGDLMIDSYVWGEAERISPEAPVPILRVTKTEKRLGGAGNVARNLKSLGADPLIVTVTGNDTGADDLTDIMDKEKLNYMGLIFQKGRKTTVKTRVIAGHQHMVRIDEESTEQLSERLEDKLIAEFNGMLDLHKPKAVILQDYNKGVLTPRVIETVIEKAGEKGIRTVVDPKKNNFFAYNNAHLFKPNLKELCEAMQVPITHDREKIMKMADELRRRVCLPNIMVTMSEHGLYLNDSSNDFFIKAHERKIVDVSGAGDSVIAVAALCVAQNISTDVMAHLCNLAGGIACEQVGVSTVGVGRLAQEYERLVVEERL